MFKKYLRRIEAISIIEAIVYDAIGKRSYEFLSDHRTRELHYNNEDIYSILKDDMVEEDWTQNNVDETLKLCVDFGLLTPKLLKKYVSTFFDGVKLCNVKINDWNNISFTVKFTEPRIFYLWNKVTYKIDLRKCGL